MSSKRPRILSLFLLIFITQFRTIVQAACYFPNGALSPNDSPCRDDTENSVCCGQGYACLSNGICQATGEELQKPGATKFVRGGCTDKTWRSSSCPLFCIDEGVDNTAGGMGLAKCPDTKQDVYWCINKNQGGVDCDAGLGLLFFPGTPSAITTIGVTPETTRAFSSVPFTSVTVTSGFPSTTSLQETVASSVMPQSTQTASESSTPEAQPTSQAAVIGGAIGGAAAVLILGGVGFWWWFTKIRKGKRPVQEQNMAIAPPYEVHGPKDYPSVTEYPSRAPTVPPYWTRKSAFPQEMSAVTMPQELPATPLPYQRY